jgi:hypothetical protein
MKDERVISFFGASLIEEKLDVRNIYFLHPGMSFMFADVGLAVAA